MADRSTIEWTDATWNPVRARRRLGSGTVLTGWHCTHASEGCRYCYAEAINRRLGTKLGYKPGNLAAPGFEHGRAEIFLDEKMLLLPLKWKAPRKIFAGSMTDLFADFVTNDMRDRIFAVAAQAFEQGRGHVLQFLTKRSAQMLAYFADDKARRKGIRAAYDAMGLSEVWLPTWPLPNVFLGVSVEDRKQMLERGCNLNRLANLGWRTFWSAEPLLGDLGSIHEWMLPDWVICGGESGQRARPMDPDWARSLRDQCAAAGVPFFFKQWGAWAPYTAIGGIGWQNRTPRRASYKGPTIGAVLMPKVGYSTEAFQTRFADNAILLRFGKTAAGRLLDGVEHNGMPA